MVLAATGRERAERERGGGQPPRRVAPAPLGCPRSLRLAATRRRHYGGCELQRGAGAVMLGA